MKFEIRLRRIKSLLKKNTHNTQILTISKKIIKVLKNPALKKIRKRDLKNRQKAEKTLNILMTVITMLIKISYLLSSY